MLAQERRLSAALLQDVNVVDTPGTNVILEHHQRLTEEYIPQADLVLFVVTADRPFTQSEVDFLKYIRWPRGGPLPHTTMLTPPRIRSCRHHHSQPE